MIQAVFLVLLAETFTMVGQILYKKSADKLGSPQSNESGRYVKFILGVLRMPGVWAGLFAMALGLFIWLLALSKFELSLVFPISSIQYILGLIGSKVFLREKIDRGRLIGTLLVAVGIVAISFS